MRVRHISIARRYTYLERKGIAAHGLRVDQAGRLLVPMHDADGQIWSMQTINAAGEKFYEKGARKQGMHALLGELASGTPLLIAEGFATGAMLRELTGLPVAVAFDAANLLPVAEIYRARGVERPIVIAGDNDHHLLRRAPPLPNVGKEKAEAAALAVRGVAVIPAFAPDAAGSDWNDHAALHGREATRAALTARLGEHGIRVSTLPPEAYTVAVQPITERARLHARRRTSEDQAPRPTARQGAGLRARESERQEHSQRQNVGQAERDAARRAAAAARVRPAQVNREHLAARQRSQATAHEAPRPGVRP